MKCFPLIDDRPTCIDLHDFINDGGLSIVTNIDEADIIVVGGGDGFMLHTMRKYHTYGKPFLGLNCGTLGFLLNKYTDSLSSSDIDFSNLESVSIQPVSVQLIMKNGEEEEGFFFNDCVIGGSVLDYVSFTVDNSQKSISAKGTGIVINSMLGSTGYALNLGQPLIPVTSDMWGVVGIASAPFRYGFIEPEKTEVTWSSRNEMIVGLDGYNCTYEGVSSIEIRKSTTTTQLLFFKDHPFEEKRLLLAEEKLGR